MAGTINFTRDFAEFGPQVRDFEKENDVGYVVTEMTWFAGQPYYPVGTLMSALISSVWLGEDEPSSEETIDLVLRMSPPEHDAPDDYFFYEIILRGETAPYYGGFVDGSNLRVTDEIVNGHRVLETDFEGSTWRYVYMPGYGNGLGQYQFQQVVQGLAKTTSVRRRGKSTNRGR